jgi:hypothetical protein
MVNLQLEDAWEANMKELFHTEDCGLSLICRCCRGPVCEQRLTKADRLRVHHELWAQKDRRRYGFQTRLAKRHVQQFFVFPILALLARVTRLL